MLLNIDSWDGNALNDSNYSCWFAPGQPAGVSASPAYSPRSRTYPKLSAMEIGATEIELHIQTKGTIHSQLDELRAWFNVFDQEAKALVVEDAADSDRQWYVMARPSTPVRVSENGVGEYVVRLAVDEPLWRTVIVASDTKAISASGQSKALTVLGNYYAKPIFTLTLNGTKGSGGGYAFSLWKPWYNPMTKSNNEPLDFTNGGINTTNLISDTTISNQINNVAGITATATSIAIDTSVGGGLPTTGGMCYVDTEQIYYTSISAGTMTVYDDGAGTTGRGWGGTTAATHANNAVMKKSHILANLNDVRIFDGANEIDRWCGSVGSATKIWVRPGFAPAVTLTLASAMTTGTQTTVSVGRTPANYRALGKLPARFMAVIDSEIFFCRTPVPQKYSFVVIARAQKGTSAATHAANATVRWLEHDLTLAYGDPLATAPDQDDSIKPIFDLDSSTNASLVYTSLKSEDNLREGGWTTAITTRRSPAVDGNSRIYTASQNADADPATDLGFAVKAHYASGTWRAENFTGEIKLHHPAGITTVTVTGKKRRESSAWITFKMQVSLDGIVWTDVFTEDAPSTTATYEALDTHSSVATGGNYPYVRFLANGSVPSIANNANYFEIAGGTYAVNSSYIPQVAFATSASNGYYVDATFSITETGESFRLAGAAKTGDVIVVDCDAETITLNGHEGGIGITFNTPRDEWLDLPSNDQSGTCTLVYTETGVTDVDIDIDWEHRAIL